jgi:hypothetical protein
MEKYGSATLLFIKLLCVILAIFPTAQVRVSSGSRDEQLVLQQQQLSRQRTKMKTTTIISTDGAMVVSHPEPAFADKVETS